MAALQAEVRQAQSASDDQAAALQCEISALQGRLAAAEADLAAAQARVQQLEQQLQAQQAEAAGNEKRMAAQMEQLKMDVGFRSHDANPVATPVLLLYESQTWHHMCPKSGIILM